jgi:leucyl-tRNA synthetase
MSKSRGNVVAPDEQVNDWGADTFRAYLMFLGPWEQGGPYDVKGIVGVSRWLHRVWNLVVDPPERVAADEASAADVRRIAHRTLAKVSDDLPRMRLNTMVAALMELTNGLQRWRDVGSVDAAAWNEAIELLLLMLAPSAPHLAEELWERSGHAYSVHQQRWPQFDPALAAEDVVEIAVQVNGRVRDRLELPVDADEGAAIEAARALPRVSELLADHEVVRVVYVPGRLLNIVVR